MGEKKTCISIQNLPTTLFRCRMFRQTSQHTSYVDKMSGQKFVWARKNSSRVRPVRSPTRHQMSAPMAGGTVRPLSEQVWKGIQSWLPDITTRRDRALYRGGTLYSGGGGGALASCLHRGGACTARSNASWVMVTRIPLWSDGQDWKHYLPATSLAGGNKLLLGLLLKILHEIFHLNYLLAPLSWTIRSLC